MHFRAKRWEMSKQYYEKALDIDPDWSDVETEIDYICEQIKCT
jgi:hypothetical protein